MTLPTFAWPATSAKDVRELADLEHADRLWQLIRLLAARTAQELNVADLARELNIPLATARRYVPLFETIYVRHSVPAWSRNLSAKVVRRPKVHFVDSGLAAQLIGTDVDALARPGAVAASPLLETFVAGEVARQLTWSGTDTRLFHWRDRDGAEVDLVIERANGDVVGIEVKASVDTQAEDFRGLRYLRDRLGDQFVAGYVVHCGRQPRPAGPKLWSIPVSTIWTVPSGPERREAGATFPP